MKARYSEAVTVLSAFSQKLPETSSRPRYRKQSAASSPPAPSSSVSTFNTSSGGFGSCCKDGRHSTIVHIVQPRRHAVGRTTKPRQNLRPTAYTFRVRASQSDV